MPLSHVLHGELRVIGLLLLLVTLVGCEKPEPETAHVTQSAPDNTAPPPKSEVTEPSANQQTSEPITPAPWPKPAASANNAKDFQYNSGKLYSIHPDYSEYNQEMAYPPRPMRSPHTKANKPATIPEIYHVIVSGSKHLKLPGSTGLLNVWIGDINFKPPRDNSMNSAVSDINAAGEYALIEANAPDFDVTGPDQKCIFLHPSGVDTKFYLSAKSAGDFEVSATVNLFNTDDCSGPAIPKTANKLSVNVVVDEEVINEQRKQGFVDIFWEKATEFWVALLALIFGVILFLVRKVLKTWLGYVPKDPD